MMLLLLISDRRVIVIVSSSTFEVDTLRVVITLAPIATSSSISVLRRIPSTFAKC